MSAAGWGEWLMCRRGKAGGPRSGGRPAAAGTQRWFQATVALVLAAAVVVGTLLPGVAAAQSQPGGGFPDTQGHWAEKHILQMALKGAVKGYNDGTFQPGRAVSRLEAVVMLVRIVGLEQQARSRTSIPASFSNPDFVPDWARGYVAVAVEQGIIAGPDLTAFRGADPATRLECAVFFVRSLGLTDQAAARAGTALDFTDAALVPSALAGYVALAVDEGIILGNPDGTFRPGSAVTRAEMATMLARLDEIATGLDFLEVKGTLTALQAGLSPSVTVRRAQDTVVIPVAPTCRVYAENLRVALGSLAVGDDVTVILDDLQRAAFIETQPPSETVTGTIQALTPGPPPGLTLTRADGTRSSYSLGPGVRIHLDGKWAPFSGLKAGLRCSVVLRLGRVLSLDAESQVEQVEGVLVAAMAGPPSLITVNRGTAGTKTYTVSPQAAITRAGKSATLAQLQPGDGLVLQVKGDQALSIAAQSLDREIKGVLEAVTFGAPCTIKVKSAAGTETLPLASRCEIERDGKAATLLNLRPGDEVEVTLRRGEVTAIDAEPVEEDVAGTLVSIHIAQVPSVTILTEDGEERTFAISPDATIRRNRQRLDVRELEPGATVEAEVQSGEIVKMDVQFLAVLQDLKGTIKHVVEKADVLVVEVDPVTPGGSAQEREIHVDADTLIIRSGELIELGDLEEDERVICIGTSRLGVFLAQVIVVISTTVD
ncbi:MAG: S-layer homology domain-containing protein [Acetobacteraceae bacterium]|nr:S-layer homology domain-containing protein [Acetobacteraceae bacterium]